MAVNTKKNRENLYVSLSQNDWLTKLASLLKPGGGYFLRLEDAKLVPRLPSIGYESPWIYVQSRPEARCDIYQKVFFGVLKHIHSYCRECWKVVVRPRTVVELFDLYELEREMGVPCKCGMEVRDTVNGLYGGYFYNRGKQEGLERYAQVRSLVDERLSTEVPVILKRYCTEYEIGENALGPSDKTEDVTFEQKEMEQDVESLFPRIGFGTPQPDWMIRKVMRDWIHYAYKNGDQTYKEFTGGHPLFPPYVTYHNQEVG